MTKPELVMQVALKTELTKQQTAEGVDLLLQCIIEALQAGDKVELRGFGSFRRRASARFYTRQNGINGAISVHLHIEKHYRLLDVRPR